MIAVIFEVVLAEGRRDEYLSIAASLRPLLAQIDGFVSIERFESLAQRGKILSLSIWRDESAVQRWRNLGAHRVAQAAGRAGIFNDYRLRVASVMRDYAATRTFLYRSRSRHLALKDRLLRLSPSRIFSGTCHFRSRCLQ
jgi:heme-degrading monooxygenase HmoA